MKTSKISCHAKKRMQQRAISKTMVLLIESFGVSRYQSGGYEVSYIDKNEIARLREAIDRIEGVTLVCSRAGTLVTAMHQDRRLHSVGRA